MTVSGARCHPWVGFIGIYFTRINFTRSINSRVEEFFTRDWEAGSSRLLRCRSDLPYFSLGSPSVEARGEINIDSENNLVGIRSSIGRVP